MVWAIQEITVARNYAVGAGGYFKGIDACHSQANTRTTRWIKKHTNQTMSPTPPRQLLRGQPG